MTVYGVLSVQTKTSKFGIRKQNRLIGIRILVVDNIFLTCSKMEFVEHYEVFFQ